MGDKRRRTIVACDLHAAMQFFRFGFIDFGLSAVEWDFDVTSITWKA